jgi:hypothetical protein
MVARASTPAGAAAQVAAGLAALEQPRHVCTQACEEPAVGVEVGRRLRIGLYGVQVRTSIIGASFVRNRVWQSLSGHIQQVAHLAACITFHNKQPYPRVSVTGPLIGVKVGQVVGNKGWGGVWRNLSAVTRREHPPPAWHGMMW